MDHILPRARYRGTLSLPKRIRFPLAKDAKLLRDVRSIGLRKIFAYQRRKARELGAKDGRPASVSFTQRFGLTLNVHPHFHHILGDCLFAQDEDGSVRVVGRLSSTRRVPPSARSTVIDASRPGKAGPRVPSSRETQL